MMNMDNVYFSRRLMEFNGLLLNKRKFRSCALHQILATLSITERKRLLVIYKEI